MIPPGGLDLGGRRLGVIRLRQGECGCQVAFGLRGGVLSWPRDFPASVDTLCPHRLCRLRRQIGRCQRLLVSPPGTLCPPRVSVLITDFCQPFQLFRHRCCGNAFASVGQVQERPARVSANFSDFGPLKRERAALIETLGNLDDRWWRPCRQEVPDERRFGRLVTRAWAQVPVASLTFALANLEGGAVFLSVFVDVEPGAIAGAPLSKLARSSFGPPVLAHGHPVTGPGGPRPCEWSTESLHKTAADRTRGIE